MLKAALESVDFVYDDIENAGNIVFSAEYGSPESLSLRSELSHIVLNAGQGLRVRVGDAQHEVLRQLGPALLCHMQATRKGQRTLLDHLHAFAHARIGWWWWWCTVQIMLVQWWLS